MLPRLKERKLVQWVLGYVAGAVAAYGAVDTFSGPWAVADSTLRALQIVLTAGLGVVIVLAWYHGERGRQRVNSAEALLLTGLVILGGLGAWWVKAGDDGSMTPAVRSETGLGAPLAVLQFDAVSSVQQDVQFAAGLHQMLIDELMKIQGLRPLPRRSVLRFAEEAYGPIEIGELLGVDHLLDGFIQGDGESLQILLELYDATTTERVWDRRYQVTLRSGSMFELQETMARDVARQVEIALTPADEARLALQRPTDNEVWAIYAEARTRVETPRTIYARTAEETDSVIALFEQVLDREPDFLEAKAALAWFMAIEGRRSLPSARGEALLNRASRLASEVLRRAPNHGEAYVALTEERFARMDWPAADSLSARAVELSPNLWSARYMRGFVLVVADRLEEALAELRLVLDLNPNGAGIGQLTWTHFFNGDYEEAIETSRMLIEVAPSVGPELALVPALMESERYREAVETMSEWAEAGLVPRAVLLRTVAEGHARAGDRPAALEVLRRLPEEGARAVAVAEVFARLGEADSARVWLAREKSSELPAVGRIADVHALLGEPDSMIAWLDRIDNWREHRILTLRHSPTRTAFRQDPGYRQLVRRVEELWGLPRPSPD